MHIVQLIMHCTAQCQHRGLILWKGGDYLKQVEVTQELDTGLQLVALASQAQGCLGVVQGAPQQVPGACQVLQQWALLLL